MAQFIRADVMIPGRGAPVENAVVVFHDGRITFAGDAAGAPMPATDDVVTEVATVMPGMWDTHAHFVGLATAHEAEMATTHATTLAARATADLQRLLDAGFTSVREVGGMGVHLAPVIDEGTIAGPRIHGAGRILSTTGGHGDLHGLPLGVAMEVCCSTNLAILCDGVPEVLRSVRINLRSNAKLIKLCASGGVMSELDDPMHQQFSDEELVAAVTEAARAERIVAAHCHGKAGIMAALRAGCHTIEHGSYLDEEAADLMVEKGAMLVPTRYVIDGLLRQKDRLSPHAWEKGQAIAEHHRAAMEIAVAKGVRIAVGCDIFVSGDMYGHGSREVQHLIDAGMSDLDAVEAATANGPDTLGPQAPQSGRLFAGHEADVIAFDANPLDDRSVWGAPDRVTHVWQRGVRVK